MIEPSALMSRSGLPVSPRRREVSVTRSSETVLPAPSPRRCRMPLPASISHTPNSRASTAATAIPTATLKPPPEQQREHHGRHSGQKPPQRNRAASNPLRHRLAGMMPVAGVQSRPVRRFQAQPVFQTPLFGPEDANLAHPKFSLVDPRSRLP
jgi:hypothetical protein